jgi:maltose alpha-D-glucosyltransferase/alpha-amylase
VGGMLRSFDYAAATLKRELPVSLSARARSAAEARADAWVKQASLVYVDSYLREAAPAADRPLDVSTVKHVIAFFTLQKALYEVLYEAANRPHWICIPLKGVLTLLDESAS